MHYNDLLDLQSSGRAEDEFTYFYVGDVFKTPIHTMYGSFLNLCLLRNSALILRCLYFCEFLIDLKDILKQATPAYF